ncbi:hypothetical protein [Arcobacter sp. YIC-80]|uniref:hypothetical protein n=1 Tax=unclassified Arcobacter TaxID=2593671 RepID=UPI00384DC512
MSKVTISEFIISVVELIEAQVEEIKLSFSETLKGLILFFLAVLIFFTTIIFLLLGIKASIAIYWGEIPAYFLTALITMIIGLIILKVSAWKIKNKR